MKKLSILAFALLLVTGFAFAQLDESSVDLSAEASATFGADLDEGVIGISNDFSVDLEWTIVPEGSQETGMEPEVYGWISINDLAVTVEGSATPGDVEDVPLDVLLNVDSVEAKVVIGPAYISVTDTSFTVDKAGNIVEPGEINLEDDDYTELITTANMELDPDPEYVGVALGADMDMFAFDLSIASAYDWVDDAGVAGDDRNLDNAWVLGLDASISAVENVTVEIVSAMWFGVGGGQPLEAGNPAAVGVAVGYDLAMGDLTMTPELASDFFFYNGADDEMWTDMEFAVGVNALDEDDNGFGLGLLYGMYQFTADESISALAVNVGATEASGDDGLLPVLGADAIINYGIFLPNENLAIDDAESYFAAGLELSADLDVAMPYLGIVTGSTLLADANGATAIDPAATIQLGVDLTMVPNTTFTIEWLSGDITADDAVVTGYAEDEWILASGINSGTTGDKLGVLTITTTIAY